MFVLIGLFNESLYGMLINRRGAVMSLTGVWLNESKSVMVLQDPGDGSLRGRYRSTVGRDTGIRELAGRTSSTEGDKQMIGFAVCFEIADPRPGYAHASLCSWSGWSDMKDGKQRIKTRWLLSTGILHPSQEWGGTLIGDDNFELVLTDPDEHYLEASQETLHELVMKTR